MKIDAIIENMREPKVKDIRAVSHISSDEEREIMLISNLTGLTSAEIDELTFKEYGVLQKKLKTFL